MLLACIIVSDDEGEGHDGHPHKNQEPGIEMLTSHQRHYLPHEDQNPNNMPPPAESRLNIFEKQVELGIRRIRADCFKRLLVLKPDYIQVREKESADAILEQQLLDSMRKIYSPPTRIEQDDAQNSASNFNIVHQPSTAKDSIRNQHEIQRL